MKLADLPEIDRRALRELYRPLSCANLGWLLWGDRPVGSNCSCPYARPAGKVVSRLRALKLVERNTFNDNMWRASPAGLKLLAEAEEHGLADR